MKSLSRSSWLDAIAPALLASLVFFFTWCALVYLGSGWISQWLRDGGMGYEWRTATMETIAADALLVPVIFGVVFYGLYVRALSKRRGMEAGRDRR